MLGDVLLPPAELVATATSILIAAGTEPGRAEVVARSLVEANLAGHDSHGVLRLPEYVAFVDPAHVFSIDLSVRFALNTIIGGTGTAIGPWIGSIFITSLETFLRATSPYFIKAGHGGLTALYLVIYGAVLIVVVRFVPEGMAGVFQRLRARRAARAHA